MNRPTCSHMKSMALACAILASGSATAFAQTTLASWGFDTATISGTSVAFGPISADTGSGSAMGSHASSATVWSSPAGNGSAKSFSSNNWGVGDYYQFQTSSVGDSGIAISWDQYGSSTGPKDFTLQYSSNGSSWTNYASYCVLGTPAWSTAGSRNNVFTFSYNLSSVTGLDNQSTISFRLTDADTTSVSGGTVGTSGTDRVDNYTVTAIPEPSAYALLVGLGGFALVLLRRKTHADSNAAA
jgi:hypothetical protein